MANSTKILKLGAGNVMVWSSVSWDSTGLLQRIIGKIAGNNLPVIWIFIQKYDPNHAWKLFKIDDDKHVEVLNWPVQSADLNPIENLWNVIKSC